MSEHSQCRKFAQMLLDRIDDLEAREKMWESLPNINSFKDEFPEAHLGDDWPTLCRRLKEKK